ncbi:MAG: hypothetical protein J6Y91_02320 [Alphaproteobacteria bacterium]|nr:hypothetical protein [Alphaproteobacteria bacterium]
MSLISKIITSGLVLGMALVSAGNAYAEEEQKKEETSSANGILFRVENIQPQKNNEGLITKCKFIVTAYNRTDTGVRSAVLTFKWVDNISAKYKIDGDQVKPVTAAEAVTTITKEVKLNSLAAHKQRSFEEVVETDKCFLLFDSLDFKVDSCQFENEAGGNKNKNVGDCAKSFEYINSKNPEYYSEFRDVPDSVIERQVEDEKKQEVAKINKATDESMADLKETAEILEKIK